MELFSESGEKQRNSELPKNLRKYTYMKVRMSVGECVFIVKTWGII